MEKKTKIIIVVCVALFIALVIVVKTAERNGSGTSGQSVPFYKSYERINSGLLFWWSHNSQKKATAIADYENQMKEYELSVQEVQAQLDNLQSENQKLQDANKKLQEENNSILVELKNC